jgi:hypothetical protein
MIRKARIWYIDVSPPEEEKFPILSKLTKRTNGILDRRSGNNIAFQI